MSALAVLISESAGFCRVGIEENPHHIYKMHFFHGIPLRNGFMDLPPFSLKQGKGSLGNRVVLDNLLPKVRKIC